MVLLLLPKVRKEVVVMAVLAEEVGGRGNSAASGNESKTVCFSFLSVLNGLDSIIISR